jgi:hypothetical protein
MFFSRSCLAWLGTILQRDSIRELGNRVGYSRPRSFSKKNKVSECAERFCIKKLIINRGTNILKELSELFFYPVYGILPRDFRLQVFFHGSVSPKALGIPLEPFQIISKIRGDIRSSRCTTGVVDKWKNSE